MKWATQPQKLLMISFRKNELVVDELYCYAMNPIKQYHGGPEITAISSIMLFIGCLRWGSGSGSNGRDCNSGGT